MRSALEAWTAPDEQQERLRREFLDRLDDGPQALHRDGRPSHLTASAIVLDADRTSVLLVHHRRTGLWLQPGGHVEDGDASLADAALREAVEETGIAGLRLLAGEPVHLERHRAPCGAEHHLDVRFAVLAPAGAAPTASEESVDAAWYALDALPEQDGVDLQSLVAAAVPAGARPARTARRRCGRPTGRRRRPGRAAPAPRPARPAAAARPGTPAVRGWSAGRSRG